MTQSRIERVAALDAGSTWLLAAAVVAWAFIGFYLAHWGARWALDLRVYRAAGASLYHHGAPYASTFTPDRLPFTYPPFALLVLGPLSLGPLGLMKALWWLLNQIALIGLLYLVIVAALRVPRRTAVLLAAVGGAVATLALEPLRSNLDYGQINLLLMGLVVLDVTRVGGRARGILVGIAAAVKLTPLVYLAYFVVSRDRRSAYRGAAAFVGLSALSWAILPSDSARYWFHEAFSPARTGPVGLVSNQSWNGVAHRVPFHAGAVGVALWLGASGATLVVGVLAAKWLSELGRPVDALLALALTELLVSPVSWSHHWSWVVLVPVVLAARWGKDRSLTAALAAVLVLAIAEPYWWSVHGWVGGLLGDSLTLAGAVLLVVLARGAKRALRFPVAGATVSGR
jgi:alpha-1,2-mannosyltransferase